MNKRQHKPFSKEEFERVLLSVSAFREFPDSWYTTDWVEDGDSWARENVETKEFCYFIPIILNPTRLLKIYSSVDKRTGWSRESRTDSIRIVLADNTGEPKHPRFKRINRNGNWRPNLWKRIAQTLRAGGVVESCPRCGHLLNLWRNSNNNSRFLSCSNRKKCIYKQDFIV